MSAVLLHMGMGAELFKSRINRISVLGHFYKSFFMVIVNEAAVISCFHPPYWPFPAKNAIRA